MGKVSRNNNPNRQRNEPRRNDEKGPKNARHGKRIIGKANREVLTKKIGKAPKGKKHKKIKAIDPFYHGDRKNIHEKKFLNKVPKNADDDHFPGKLREIMKLKEELKNKHQKKSKPTESAETAAKSTGRKKTYIPVPSAQNASWPKPVRSNPDERENPVYVPEGQKEGETPVEYLRRMNQELSDVVEKTMLFKKFGINFAEMNSGKMEKLYGMNDKKRNRLKEIAKEKKERKLEKKNDSGSGFEHLKDSVEFGEVVMSPPDKLAKPRHADSSTLSKPGRKDLLLKNVIQENSTTNNNKTEEKQTTTTKKDTTTTKKDKYSLKKTVKLKHLSLCKQSILNKERERVVQLYREMKKKNRISKE